MNRDAVDRLRKWGLCGVAGLALVACGDATQAPTDAEATQAVWEEDLRTVGNVCEGRKDQAQCEAQHKAGTVVKVEKCSTASEARGPLPGAIPPDAVACTVTYKNWAMTSPQGRMMIFFYANNRWNYKSLL